MTQLSISATYSSSAKKHPDLDICYLHLILVRGTFNLIWDCMEIFILFLRGGVGGINLMHFNECMINQRSIQLKLQNTQEKVHCKTSLHLLIFSASLTHAGLLAVRLKNIRKERRGEGGTAV